MTDLDFEQAWVQRPNYPDGVSHKDAAYYWWTKAHEYAANSINHTFMASEVCAYMVADHVRNLQPGAHLAAGVINDEEGSV